MGLRLLFAVLAMASLSYAVLCVLRGVTHGHYWHPIYRDAQPLRFWYNIVLFALIFPAAFGYAFVQVLNR